MTFRLAALDPTKLTALLNSVSRPSGPIAIKSNNSPELNLIEILWKKIKYEWLPLDCCLSYDSLKKAVFDVLSRFGNEYQITFV
jgi:transposase